MNSLKKILTAFFLSEFARAMYFVTVTWMIDQQTNDALYTALLIGFGFLPGLVLNLFLGVIVDRFNRKKLSVLANLLCTFSMSILLFFFTFEMKSFWLIIVVHMLLQVAGSLFRPAIQAFIAECFEKEHLPKIFSQSSSAAIVGGLIGSLVGGGIISFVSISGTMAIVTGSFAIASILLMVINNKVTEKPKNGSGDSVLRDITGGFLYIKNNNLLFGLFIIMFNGQLVFHTSLGFLSVYTSKYLLQSSTIYGIMDATISMGGVFAGLLGTWWWKKSKNRLGIYSLFIVLVGLLLVGLAPVLSVAFLGVFLIGLGTTWIRVLLQSVQQMATDPEYHGRMASYRMIGNQGSVVISAPLLGWIASNYGANFIYLSLIVPISLCIIYAVLQTNHEQFKKIINKVV